LSLAKSKIANRSVAGLLGDGCWILGIVLVVPKNFRFRSLSPSLVTEKKEVEDDHGNDDDDDVDDAIGTLLEFVS